jgi:ankyrin repeat protein
MLFEQTLVAASGEGYLDIVRVLVQSGVDLDASVADDEGNNACTALNAAICGEHPAVANFLLQQGARCSPDNLVFASYYGLFDVVRNIVEKRLCDIDATSRSGYTALHDALLKGHRDVVHLLLEHGATCGSVDDLCAASRAGLLEIVCDIVDTGVDVNATNRSGWTALQLALCHKHRRVADFLLVRGATCALDIDLFAAVRSGFLDFVWLALQNGADVNVSGRYTYTSDGDLSSDWHGSALQASLTYRSDTAVELLLESGAVCDSRDLVIACHNGNTRIVQDILARLPIQSPDINVPRLVPSLHGEPQTPMQAARRHPDVAVLLLEHGAACTSDDLVAACESGDLRYVREVLRRGVDAKRPGRATRGDVPRTPLEVARAEGLPHIVALLGQYQAF